MILKTILAGLALLLAALSAQANTSIYPPKGRDFAIGGVLGYPTGVSTEQRLTNGDALDGALGFSGGLSGDFLAVGDYISQIDVWKFRDKDHPLYWGLGAYFRSGGTPYLGIRIPLNLILYWGPSQRLQGFFQLVPTIRVSPALTGEGTLALGFRYFL